MKVLKDLAQKSLYAKFASHLTVICILNLIGFSISAFGILSGWKFDCVMERKHIMFKCMQAFVKFVSNFSQDFFSVTF